LTGREDGHCPTSSAKFKNGWSYTSLLPYVFIEWSRMNTHFKQRNKTFRVTQIQVCSHFGNATITYAGGHLCDDVIFTRLRAVC